jgi:sugar lactone lactonase YvrE
MRTQSLFFAALLFALSLTNADAQTPASKPAPVAAPRAAQPDGANLREDQIKKLDSATLKKLAEGYNARGDIQRFVWSLQRLAELQPNSGPLKLQLAVAYAVADDKAKAYDLLVHMQTQGFGYDLSKDVRFDKIHGTKVWDYIVANLQANSKPFGEGRVAFELPAKDLLNESLAYDPKRKSFLTGSLREGKVFLVDKEGKLSDFVAPDASNGLWSVHALAVDAPRDLLYVASANIVQTKRFNAEDFGKSGVFKFQLSSGKFLGKALVPNDGESNQHLVSALVVGKDGQVYAADGIRNEIYKLETAGLKLIMRNPQLTSVRGIALSDDGKTLYFADYSLGLFGIDLSKGKGFDIKYNPEKLVLGGIDGLYYYQGTLTVIESGMNPQRVMRLKLSADGRSIAGTMPLDVAQPAFDRPTFGAVVGSDLYFIANSQKYLYDQYGVLKDESKLKPTRVYKSDLRYEWDKNSQGADLAAIPGASPEQAKKLIKETGTKTGEANKQ